MSTRIVILEPEVVNQIAAGEVVERPASVVKELVENALDAGARRIDVEVEQGGQRLIRVADDGHGMTPEEAVLALERHATSKLRRTDDLLSIRSMGFRGEALPSIASVSRLTLVTRPPGADAGFGVRVDGGQQPEPGRPEARSVGTTVEVADLFFNTPARLKFLKSTATENAHIADSLNRLALANPEVHIGLAVDGRRSLELLPCPGRLERARAVIGRRGALTGGQYAEEGLEVEACLGAPQETTRSARTVHLLVNRRTVRDRSLIHAVVAGYDTLIERGRFPLAVVHVEIDPSLVDVNVHPQKTEVRFTEPGRVFAAIRRCVHDVVARGGWGAGEAATRYPMPASPPQGGYQEHRERLEQATRRFWSARAREGDETGEEDEAAGQGPFSRLRPVGQVLGTYLVLEDEDGEGLVLIDQHAAHERVTFERLRRAWREGAVPSQTLLIPGEVALDSQAAAAAGEHGAELERLGIELEPFGRGVWAIRSVPTWLAGADPAALVRDVLDGLVVSGGHGPQARGQDAVLASMACHGSVRAGQVLEPREVRALLEAMDRIDFAEACPHGRPVTVRLTRSELERRFGR